MGKWKTSRLAFGRSGGFVGIAALAVVVVVTAAAVALMVSTTSGLAQTSNLEASMEARLAAESGMSVLLYEVARSGVSGSLRSEALVEALADALSDHMDRTTNLGAQVVVRDGLTINIPSIRLEGGRSFRGQVTATADDTLRLTATGQFSGGATSTARIAQRQLSIDIHPMWDPAMGFGICSKGPIAMGMNTQVIGVTHPSHGSIHSEAAGTAISCGSGHISGNVSTSAAGASASLGGTDVDGDVLEDVPPVTMPNIDRTPYTSLATTVMNLASPPAGTYKNIRIPANTNPTFGNAVTIQGVMYIQAPNKVTFNNNVTFTGVMVASDPPSGSPDSANYIYFKNNMSFAGVEALPDSSEFTDVKKLTGAAILCPGFTMEFKNNMGSVGGTVALKSLVLKNNMNSDVSGGIFIYGSAGLTLKNNSNLRVRLPSTPPQGFAGHGLPPLLADPGTYAEN